MINIVITAEGDTLEHIGQAIDEAKKHILAGDFTGTDASDDSSFTFTVQKTED